MEALNYKWKRIAAVKFRANSKINEAQFARISSVVAVALKNFQTKSIGILPVTWKNPEYCVGTIYAIWLMGYAGECIEKSPYPNPKNATLKVISQTGTKYFEEILRNVCQKMWDFWKKLGDKNKDDWLTYSFQELKNSNVEFNLTKTFLN